MIQFWLGLGGKRIPQILPGSTLDFSSDQQVLFPEQIRLLLYQIVLPDFCLFLQLFFTGDNVISPVSTLAFLPGLFFNTLLRNQQFFSFVLPTPLVFSLQVAKSNLEGN